MNQHLVRLSACYVLCKKAMALAPDLDDLWAAVCAL